MPVAYRWTAEERAELLDAVVESLTIALTDEDSEAVVAADRGALGYATFMTRHTLTIEIDNADADKLVGPKLKAILARYE